jgi:hypothetical protein
MGAYIMALSIGIAIGPLVLIVSGTESWLPFLIAAALFLVAMLPVLFARGLR